MTTKPTTDFTWDSSGANVTAVTAGHKTSGYAFGEVPTSAELNQQFKDIAAWLAWYKISIDHFFTLHQNWRDPMYAAWTSYNTGAGSVGTMTTASTTRLGPWLKLHTAGNGDTAAKYSEAVVCGNQSTQRVMALFAVDATAIAGSPMPFEFRAGWSSTPTASEGSSGPSCKVVKTTADTHWLFRTTNIAGLITTTTTSVVATGVQKFRIEMVGSTDPGGAQARLYIDEVLAATHTTNLPDCPTDADRMTFHAYLQNVAAGVVSTDVFVSPMTMYLDYI